LAFGPEASVHRWTFRGDTALDVRLRTRHRFVNASPQPKDLAAIADHFIQTKLLIYKDEQGVIQADRIEIIPSQTNRSAHRRVRADSFSGTVFRFSQYGQTPLSCLTYKNGKLVGTYDYSKRQGGRQQDMCTYFVSRKLPPLAPATAVLGSGSTTNTGGGGSGSSDDSGRIIVVYGGERYELSYYSAPCPGGDGSSSSGSNYGAIIITDGSGSTGGVTGGSGGAITPGTTIYEDGGGVEFIQATNILNILGKNNPPVLFTSEEKAFIYAYSSTAFLGELIDYIRDIGQKPNLLELACSTTVNYNLYSEGEEQLADRVLKMLGFTDYSQLEQAPFSAPSVTGPGMPILTGLLYTQKVSRETAVLQLMHPDWSSARCFLTSVRNINSGTVHFVLDAFGLVPGAGELADAINGGIYLLEGDNTSAGLSFAAMMPIGGWAATGGKWARNALKYDGVVNGYATFLSKNGLTITFMGRENRLDHVLNHLADDLSKPGGKHGVFNGTSKDAISIVDEAWEAVRKNNVGYSVTSTGSWNYIVDMGRVIGWEGGSTGSKQSVAKLLISVRPNSSELITAFPVK